jgi:nitrate/nitrite-specific signal transduction histidine kinase
VTWDSAVEVPRKLEGLAQSVLGEALRNVGKHASPSRVDVQVERDEDTFSMAVRNDGVSPTRRSRPPGMGLRIAAFEALQHGGFVEFGADKALTPSGWRVRLVVPL